VLDTTEHIFFSKLTAAVHITRISNTFFKYGQQSPHIKCSAGSQNAWPSVTVNWKSGDSSTACGYAQQSECTVICGAVLISLPVLNDTEEHMFYKWNWSAK